MVATCSFSKIMPYFHLWLGINIEFITILNQCIVMFIISLIIYTNRLGYKY